MKPSTAKSKGAQTETQFVEFLKANGVPNAERRHLSGAYDKGDISGWVQSNGSKPVCVEVKSGAQLNIQGWLRELDAEIINSKADIGFLAIRPKGKPRPEDWYIVMRTPGFIDLMREAEYITE